MQRNGTYSNSIENFLKINNESDFIGSLHESTKQVDAWKSEFETLQNALKGLNGEIIFEYGIPGLPKVVDVILLIEELIFVVEFKVGKSSYSADDHNQVMGYALRLKYYHSNSNERVIVPILVATKGYAVDNNLKVKYDKEDQIYDTVCCNTTNLRSAIDFFCEKHRNTQTLSTKWQKEWNKGIYKASQTIIEAAKTTWNLQNVVGLVDEENETKGKVERLGAEDAVLKIIESSKSNKQKSIVFVTGVPGAGKTLVGLNISVKAQQYGASMLSGNAPLVEVFTVALRRNLDLQFKTGHLKINIEENVKVANKQNEKKRNLEKNKIAIETILRSVYATKDDIINNRLDYSSDDYTMRKDAQPSQQHVIIYDEAQRAWSRDQMIKHNVRSGKKDWQTDSWKLSEPEVLMWDINQLDWGVMVCLIGGGQEINEGESGIGEWLRAIAESDKYRDWNIYLAPDLTYPEYNTLTIKGQSITDYLKTIKEIGNNIKYCKKLHLYECQRSTRASGLSTFINSLVEGNALANDYNLIRKSFPIYLTRDLEKAKQKIKERQQHLSNRAVITGEDGTVTTDSNVRMGVLMSSNAQRIRPLGYEVKKVGEYLSKAPIWFLDNKEDNVDSSDSLEIAFNEFFVQGLEIDLSLIIWDADFRFIPGKGWQFYKFGKNNWSLVEDKTITPRQSEKRRKKISEENQKKAITRFYMRNAYRVLLTRARSGMIICVPKGTNKADDPTRDSSFYDSTYNYLKSLGFIDLDNENK